MRKRGYPLVQVVERWNAFAKRRVDLFGIIDVVAVGADIVGIQTTSAGNLSARLKKIADSNALPVLRQAGFRLLLHGWRKNAAGRWVLREVDVS